MADSLVAQMVKSLPAIQETWVRSLGWEDPLEEDMATHSSILSWRVSMDRGAWIDWLDLLAVQGTLKSLLQHHSSKASILQRSAL